ncbi:MAG: prenyltransferase [Pseudonocardiaceae bacterium]|nr:prenyltransferase [Pseudonocardiaceae bacterium]
MDSHNAWFGRANKAVSKLLAELPSDPFGKFSPSVYETGRVVTFAPELAGHLERVQFLLDRQHEDGSWGGPDEYRLVPALSATEALLSTLRNTPDSDPVPHAPLVRAAATGLDWLFSQLNGTHRVTFPDTVAVEIVVPGLIDEINTHLDRLDDDPLPGLDPWRGTARLVVPDGAACELLSRLREAVEHGRSLPTKVLHSLEVLGNSVHGASFVEPLHGVVGCSPAATAVWLGDRITREVDHPSVRYLVAVQELAGGPVPVAAPVTVFERSWVLSTLASAGFAFSPPSELVAELHDAFGELGAAGGLGLPPDADDTSTVLHALAQLENPRSPNCLWNYEADGHFSCFPNERTPSTSTNAHALQAFGSYLISESAEASRCLEAIGKISPWLCAQQEAEGNWWDKWHASPYYATACCAVSLAEYGVSDAAKAVAKAVDWVLGSQRADGSWGRWAGTYEETAYAVQILLRARGPRWHRDIRHATARGCDFLLRSDPNEEHPALWHDKDLYTPIRIVRAEGLAALRLAHARPDIAALVSQVDTADPDPTRRSMAC